MTVALVTRWPMAVAIASFAAGLFVFAGVCGRAPRVVAVNIGSISLIVLGLEGYLAVFPVELEPEVAPFEGPIVSIPWPKGAVARPLEPKPWLEAEPAAWATIRDLSPTAPIHLDASYQYEQHPTMGRWHKPNHTSTHRVRVKSHLLFDVTYSFDRYGCRRSPVEPVEGGPAVAFFGGSYTFGVGLADDETISSRFQVESEHRVAGINFARAGGSANTMLRALDGGLVSGVLAGRPLTAGIYTMVPDHLWRVVPFAEWLEGSPKYELIDGELVSAGFQMPALVGPTAGAYAARFRSLRLFRSFLWTMPLRTATETKLLPLWKAIVQQSARLLRERFDAPLLVIYWNSDVRVPIMVKELTSLGIPAIPATDLWAEVIDDSTSFWRHGQIPRDMHPTALANAALARAIHQRLTIVGAHQR